MKKSDKLKTTTLVTIMMMWSHMIFWLPCKKGFPLRAFLILRSASAKIMADISVAIAFN